MRRSRALAIAAGMLVAIVLVGSFATGTVFGGFEVAEKRPTVGPTASGSSAKTVVMEVFTGTWCPPCANSDPPISRIGDEYDPSELLILEYHLGSDPYTNTASTTRDTYYNIQFVPTMIVDGGGPYDDLMNPPGGQLWAIGASSNKGANYDNYKGKIESEYPSGTSLSVSLAGDMTPTAMNVDATITATDPILLSNLATRFIVYEDALYYLGSNNQPYHRYTVRDLRSVPLTIAQGETIVQSTSFPIQGTWNRNKLGIAAFVQTEDRTAITIYVNSLPYTFYNGEILNAARVDFIPAGITLYRDEPITDYQEPFERVLSQDSRHFRTWNHLARPGDTGSNDNRGPPTAMELAEHPMVIWFTGAQTSSTLTGIEQTLLTDHLANTKGHLLLSGEGIGAELGSSAFYSDVLQASFVSDNSFMSAVSGIPGDPVSGPWSSLSLTITGSSPDHIAAAGTGELTFQYTGGAGAAVRSDFDADSRVLYMGYRYFEGTDAERRNVMASIISWFDSTSGPEVFTVFPNGGEVLTPGMEYVLRWDARDVELPGNAVDLYYAADSSNPVWVPIATGEPNDGVYKWVAPSGVDSDRCVLRVVARDMRGNTGEGISVAEFTIGAPAYQDFVITLQPGINLMSFPADPSSAAVASVLNTIDPWYSWVRVYDPSDPVSPWKTWHRPVSPNGLAQLTREMAFWIEVTASSPVTLTVRGLAPLSTTISMAPGWNLVGFPSLRTDLTVASLKAATGATTVVGFDATSPTYTRVLADTEILEAGRGYWVNVPSSADWVVPYA